MVFTLCKECGQTLLVAVGIEEWHCLNALCKSNASGMNRSLQRILKNASGMKEAFQPSCKTELKDILDEGAGPDDDDYLEACAQVEAASVKGTMKPDVCKLAVPKKSRESRTKRRCVECPGSIPKMETYANAVTSETSEAFRSQIPK